MDMGQLVKLLALQDSTNLTQERLVALLQVLGTMSKISVPATLHLAQRGPTIQKPNPCLKQTALKQVLGTMCHLPDMGAKFSVQWELTSQKVVKTTASDPALGTMFLQPLQRLRKIVNWANINQNMRGQYALQPVLGTM